MDGFGSCRLMGGCELIGEIGIRLRRLWIDGCEIRFNRSFERLWIRGRD